ncbi:MAG: hypothetical protein ACJAU6_003039 [Alphaproteobacteria bacterium]
MSDLFTALALVLVIEGALYALFPDAMQRMMAQALEMPPTVLRNGGLVAAVAGFAVIWFIKAT